MASISKYKDGWRAQVEKNGQRASKVFPTRQLAQQWAARTEIEFSTVKNSRHTLEAAVDLYLRSVTPRKKEKTAVWEARRFEYFLDHFGRSTHIAKVTPAHIAEWRDERLKSVAGATVVRDSNLYRNLFTIARDEWQWIEKNPFQGVRMPADSEPREAIWGWRDIKRMLRYCQSAPGDKTRQVGVMFHISLRTGLRLKEILNAKLEGNVLILTDTKTTRAGKAVRVPTTRAGRRILQRYANETFPTMTANEASTLFSKAVVNAGLRKRGEDGLTFHDARATALTHMSRRMDVMTLQKISRHRNINILTGTYYRESAEQIAARL